MSLQFHADPVWVLNLCPVSVGIQVILLIEYRQAGRLHLLGFVFIQVRMVHLSFFFIEILGIIKYIDTKLCIHEGFSIYI